MERDDESLSIYNDNTFQCEIKASDSFNYISISPDGRLAATFNSESFTIKFYEIENLATPTIVSFDEIYEIRKLGLSSVKVLYSLAISNFVRIRGTNDVLIAVSCFFDKDMMKEIKRIDNYSMTNQDPTDIEKGDDFKKSATFVISKNLKTRIKTKADTHGGVVKFLDNRSEVEVDVSNEFTNLIVMNVTGITKAFINHDSYVMNTKESKEYEFPIIIQDNFYQDIPCTGLLQSSIVSNYLFAEDYRNKKIEMYNLKSLDLEMVFQKCDQTSLSTSLLENPIFSISTHAHLLAHCSSAKNITIYLMENGLEIVTKEFSNVNRILLVSFIDDDEKLFIVTEEPNGLMINIWDIFAYKSDTRTRKVDDTNILNSLQEDNYYSLAISNGTILASLQDGTVFSVLDHSDVKRILKPSNELINLLSIDIENAQQNNLLESHSEPWVGHKQYNYMSSYLNESKTIQLIIGQTTVQVWRKRNYGSKTKQVLEYIWANLNNERIEVTSLKVGNREFSLDLSLTSTISVDQSQDIKIHWPNETHILNDTCNAIKYLHGRKYGVRRKNQENYEKLITDTEKIIKKCIKKNPNLWRLSEIRYEIIANLIQANRILLLYQILFNFKEVNKIGTNGETNITKVNRYLHIPRQYSWPAKEKRSDLETAIEESSDEKKTIVAMLLEYYSNNAEKNIGWMFTVTKAIPSLNKRHLESCLKELFYKPCFGTKEEYLNSKFVSKFVSQNELKKGYNKKVYPLNIKPQLLEKQNSDKHSWWNMKNIKYKSSKIDSDKNTHKTKTALRIVPLPDFTVYPKNAIKSSNSSILLKFFKRIVWPKNYWGLSNQHSPFLKFLDEEENNILYDNPAIEACIEFKWNTSKNYFLSQFLIFFIFLVIFLIFYNNLFAYSLTDYLSYSLFAVVLYLGYYLLATEIAQLINEGKKYWNVYNIFDFTSISISIVALTIQIVSMNDTNENSYVQHTKAMNIISSFATLILCFEFLLLLRMFSRIANYINIIMNILKAALPFMGFMLILTFAFGTAVFGLLVTSYQEDDFTDPDNNVTDYTTTLQNFDLSNPVTDLIYLNLKKWSELDPSVFWPLFLLLIFASIALIIVMQNLLIAVMTNIYEEAKSNARLVALKFRGELISDYEKTENYLLEKKVETKGIFITLEILIIKRNG